MDKLIGMFMTTKNEFNVDNLSNRTRRLLLSLSYTTMEEVRSDVEKGVLALDKTDGLGQAGFNEICNFVSLNPNEIIKSHSLGFRGYEEFKKSGSLNGALDTILSPRTNRLNKAKLINFIAELTEADFLVIKKQAVMLSKKSQARLKT